MTDIAILEQQVQSLTDAITLKDKEIERLEIDNAGLRSANAAAVADLLEANKLVTELRAQLAATP